MALSERGMSKRFWPENATRFFRRRAMETLGLCLLTAMFLFLLANLTYNAADTSFNTSGSSETTNLLGSVGAIVADTSLQGFGLANIAVIVALGAWGLRLVSQRAIYHIIPRFFCLLIAIGMLAASFAALPPPNIWPLHTGLGGVTGWMLLQQLARAGEAFNLNANLLVIAAGLIGLTALLWCLGIKVREYVFLAKALHQKLSFLITISAKMVSLSARILNFFSGNLKSKSKNFLKTKGRLEPTFVSNGSAQNSEPQQHLGEKGKNDGLRLEVNPNRIAKSFPDSPSSLRVKRKIKDKKQNEQVSLNLTQEGEYQFPVLDLLSIPNKISVNAPEKSALEANAKLLESVLQDFGVKGEIVQVRTGPVVTLYELEPAPGTKSSRVIGLGDDIARSMSAVSVRVAVVPGRNVIGIELPNQDREMVFLRELFQSPEYAEAKDKLPIALGKDISGSPVVVDLARMPHLLIAGTTGSGKSVAVNTMILSLLYQMTPEQCRMIMIDPKMLELSIYDNIPHLLSPVVTDPKKAVVALKWTVREMESRYRAMSKLGVRNIDGYNTRLEQARRKGEVLKRRVQTGFDGETGRPVFEDQPFDLTPLPFIVVIIDEVADLMLVAGKDIEGAVQRLAQMARAAGIHVIMATQRPSVDVITGTIKANFPTRISFQVTSKIDSRTILGEQGAEQLLGQGDMLHMAGGGKVTRVHGPFVSDEEVEDVVQHLKRQGEPEFNDSITEEDHVGDPLSEYGLGIGEKEDSGDELYDQAVAIVARERKASTSFIQRHLKIGYNRAATIIERMETEGVVSGANHVGKRDVLLPDHSEL